MKKSITWIALTLLSLSMPPIFAETPHEPKATVTFSVTPRIDSITLPNNLSPGTRITPDQVIAHFHLNPTTFKLSIRGLPLSIPTNSDRYSLCYIEQYNLALKKALSEWKNGGRTWKKLITTAETSANESLADSSKYLQAGMKKAITIAVNNRRDRKDVEAIAKGVATRFLKANLLKINTQAKKEAQKAVTDTTQLLFKDMPKALSLYAKVKCEEKRIHNPFGNGSSHAKTPNHNSSSQQLQSKQQNVTFICYKSEALFTGKTTAAALERCQKHCTPYAGVGCLNLSAANQQANQQLRSKQLQSKQLQSKPQQYSSTCLGSGKSFVASTASAAERLCNISMCFTSGGLIVSGNGCTTAVPVR
ncbi:MAG: hypothetical protein ACD_70C00132G0005 [uncultured bacterium]|nr:MAG: hypothetical protein ACD_70C00132G0005 [uncultured bacterium]OGT27163.1 MAG: hypothetical protein A3B71_08665 [Gammaproteobacteria bacterium RIFCSPHIGHO2_02_FULL_42_43]OGT50779.1 MAG: hypothetical protein A3E54_00860 [Gammaproteobacteria bacterium RIFCSPHIGHO2_12_FULL_41_25]OGT61764.1 MAG: hypothetical protein A3I77_00580 [Gammaproteobacteria bacterium RIFCSPLOWO2_02_FULL_42_14]OGT85508.1 MAG: hypothetical protein A3G86_06770 [Gammaproteobacteria bacterium RIFCSPLOWO2_12_FULL_42_18]